MRFWCRLGWLAMLSILVLLVRYPVLAWGQEPDRIGTVLAVEGPAEVRGQDTATWDVLKFRDAIFLGDTVRTGEAGKVKVLLRDDAIMTLAESSEMQFTEFLLSGQQRTSTVELALGKLRVLTSRLFGSGSKTEVRTPNTVAGVRGTIFIVNFIPPETTEVLSLDGVVTVSNRDPLVPEIEPVPQNFFTRVVGNAPPTPPRELPPAERDAFALGVRLTEQVPAEVRPTLLREAAVLPRGGTDVPLPPLAVRVDAPALDTALPSTATDVVHLIEAASPQSISNAHVAIFNAENSPLTETITPDVSPAAVDVITQSQLELIITIPR